MCLGPTWIISSFTPLCVLSSCRSGSPSRRAELWAGFCLSMVSSPPCRLSPRLRGRGRGGDRGAACSCVLRCCQERHSWLSNVCTNALQNPLAPYPPASRLLLALAPCCPQGLCLPLPRSLWDPGLGGSRLCKGAPAVWPVSSATSVRPPFLSFPNILSSGYQKERTHRGPHVCGGRGRGWVGGCVGGGGNK